MAQFTSGPWNIHPAYPLDAAVKTTTPSANCPLPFDYWGCYIATGETIVAEAIMQQTKNGGWPHVEDVEEARANALLMVAAPLMFEALKDVEWGNNGHCPQCGMSRSNGEHQPHCILANALAKAEGRVIA